MQMYGMTGELLGSIGENSQTLESWKRDFLSKPSASVRRGIAWGFSNAYEDTDTLVLTVPSGAFVDIRFPKETTSASQVADHGSFWAFSGYATTTFYDKSSQHSGSVSLPYTAHCKFTHVIDSRGVKIEDEGDMFLLPNGDSIEMGIMLNPSTGQNELYKEYWTNAQDGSRYHQRWAIATIDHPTQQKGVVIQVGSRIQGISFKEDQSVQFERWEWLNDKWTCDMRSNGQLPCTWLAEDQRKAHDMVVANGVTWKVDMISD